MGRRPKLDKLAELQWDLHDAATAGNKAECNRLRPLIHRERLRRSLGSICWVIVSDGQDRDDLATGMLVGVGTVNATILVNCRKHKVPLGIVRLASDEDEKEEVN